MSRAYTSSMVGNDFVISPRKITLAKSPVKTSQEFDWPEIPEAELIPSQNSGVLAFNSPAMAEPSFAMASTVHPGSRFFSKARIVHLILTLALVGVVVGVIAERQQIVSLPAKVRSIAAELSQDMNSHKAVTPVVNPRQLIVHSSDYYSAMAVLMTQQITLNQGSYSQIVNSTTIANWLNVKTQGSLTYFTVNVDQLTGYINQVAHANGQTGEILTSSSPVINKIADNLLKAKGMTVALPTS